MGKEGVGEGHGGQDLSTRGPSVTPKQAPRLALPGARTWVPNPACILSSCQAWAEGFPHPGELRSSCAPPAAMRMKGASAWALAATGDLGTDQRLPARQ